MAISIAALEDYELIRAILKFVASRVQAGELPISTQQIRGRPRKDAGMIQHFREKGIEEPRFVCLLISAIDSKVLSGSYSWSEHGLDVTIYAPTLKGYRYLRDGSLSIF